MHATRHHPVQHGYARVRNAILGDLRSAFVLSVIPALVRPGFLVEVEVIASRT